MGVGSGRERWHGSPGAVARDVIGDWPGTWSVRARRGSAARAAGVRGGSFGARHAARVWEDVREGVAQRARGIVRDVEADAAGVEGGLFEMEFLGQIAGHIAGGCRACVVGSGIDRGDRGEDWLVWAVLQRRGLREVFLLVAGDEAGRELRKRGVPGLSEWAQDVARRGKSRRRDYSAEVDRSGAENAPTR